MCWAMRIKKCDINIFDSVYITGQVHMYFSVCECLVFITLCDLELSLKNIKVYSILIDIVLLVRAEHLQACAIRL